MDRKTGKAFTLSNNALSGNAPRSIGNNILVDRNAQIEKLTKESKALKQKVDQLEKENNNLKKSIYDLSVRYAATLQQGSAAQAYRPGAFAVDPDDLSSDLATRTHKVITQAVQEVQNESADDYGKSYRDKSTEGLEFEMKYEFKGHFGAVYSVRYSRNGKLLVSGSFDKTVRIWDAMTTQKEIGCLKGHNLNIADVSWSLDNARLVSGSYDQTCKVWDIESGRLLSSWDTNGFVQCVGWDATENHTFFYGTSRCVLGMTDLRVPAAQTPSPTSSSYADGMGIRIPTLPYGLGDDESSSTSFALTNDHMINSLYVNRDGIHVTTGDGGGWLKVWDIRNRQCVQQVLNDLSQKPISHITVGGRHGAAAAREGDEARYLAANSYDNVIKVYDRGPNPPQSEARLVHVLKGFKGRNWPIKSSFYRGAEYQSYFSKQSSATRDPYYGDGDKPTLDDDMSGLEIHRVQEASALLATGSADPYAYIFGVGQDSSKLLQRLDGHTDRVYAVDFHPSEPLLATCSADFTVKIWGPAQNRSKARS
ncbi:hypothetical protein BZG36_04198 [Bifiguratus adelaidae]|uniref:WD40 repeat-like protein n=1 Tax=Bifiguratus adelaidae TaxID=1938954 RepID=A0A261XW13_9FUNG|nr:hypothetical protein BZG36_04198 [Bifiguratus adelaidae]